MKTYEEMAQNALDRINNYETEKKKRRQTVAIIATPAVSFCLAAVLSVGIWQSGLLRQPPMQTETTDKKNNNSNVNDFSIIWANDVYHADAVGCFTTWGDSDSVSYRLYEALESGNKNDIFAILARPAIDYDFEYEGKTLGDYYSAMCDERNLPEILRQLLKEGDSLKYGEALYKTGTPTGERWDQSLYEERAAFYGNAILGKYIVDGQFLVEDLERDIAIATNSTQATDAYNKALTAYLERLAASVHGVLPSEAVPEKFGIIMYHTKDEFSAFVNNYDDIDTADWTFDLAANNNVDDETVLFGVEE